MFITMGKMRGRKRRKRTGGWGTVKWRNIEEDGRGWRKKEKHEGI
jgi:hypothetical protein